MGFTLQGSQNSGLDCVPCFWEPETPTEFEPKGHKYLKKYWILSLKCRDMGCKMDSEFPQTEL